MSETARLLGSNQTYKSKLKISLIVLNITLSSFYFGYCIVYFGQLDIVEMKKIFQTDFQDNNAKGVLNGCIPVGALFGALASSFLISRLSRRKCLLAVNAIALIAGGLIYIPSFYSLIFARLLQGFCVGAYSAVAPLIVNQLSPTELSGTLGTYMQLLVSVGVTFGCLFRYILYKATNDPSGKDYWFIIFGVTQVTVIIQTLVLLFVFPYQTPKYLLSIGKDEDARKLIQVIYKDQFVEEILQQKKNDLVVTETRRNVQVKSIFSQAASEQTKTNKIPIIVAVNLAALQQLAGINAVAVYGGEIASNAVTGELRELMATFVNFEQVLGTLVTGFLLFKFGRKTIVQYGTLLEGAANLLVAIGFFIKGDQTSADSAGQGLILTGLFLFMGVFGLSLGPVVWLYIPEIVQPAVVPFSTATNWICASLVIILFPIIKDNVLNGNPAVLFLIFTAYCFLSLVFNAKFMIETKDKKQTQIYEQYSTLKLL